jgi:hypothetical protein
MLIAALLVGLLTAYYFGVRPGMMAAGATAALCLMAMIAPHLAIFAYGAIGVGVGAVCIVGPKLRRKGSPARMTFVARAGVAEVMRRYRKLKRAGADNRRPPARRR